MLRGKKRKKKQICKVKQEQMKKIYIKINCKGKRAIGKANKGINVEKIVIGLKKLKLKKEHRKKNRKLHRLAKPQCRGRGL